MPASHVTTLSRPDRSGTGTAEAYRRAREFSERIAAPLSAEDCTIQSMPDVSPTRWHLAHTTWFFETFLLKADPDYAAFDPRYEYLFNSYYNSVGEQFPRARRGLVSRPTLEEIWEYRRRVDEALTQRLEDGSLSAGALRIVALGLQHEQQHQELMLTDIKHVLSCNPLAPAYVDRPRRAGEPAAGGFTNFAGGLLNIGHGGEGFAFDNESPRHHVYLEPYALADDLVTAGEYLAFIEDGGYERPELWLSLGWQTAQRDTWRAPLYWRRRAGDWEEFTLGGPRPLEPSLPVCHVSYFEADAFARWAGRRLPTEAEWEAAVADVPPEGHFASDPQSRAFAVHPGQDETPREQASPPRRIFGDVWEWTSSSYAAYPGYRPPAGALGEYNGKFMCNQYVLRGGSCLTPEGHIRASYRNFFPPGARWQMSGIRLANDA